MIFPKRNFRNNFLLIILMPQKSTFTPGNQFLTVQQKPNISKNQQDILLYWDNINAFHQQLQKSKHFPPYTFYDGPPFATGLPHYGHIAAGTFKDIICRYATQTGHYVERRFGWDCHGLPVQYQIDKLLGINDKRDVLKLGIKQYNNECRSIVMKYSKQWKYIINRFGRWIDFDNDYKTLNTDFMESVWYVFKQIFQKGLVYKGRKVMPYSNACNTVLSNFQTQQNYKQVQDPSIYVTFPLIKDPNVHLVAWTTTPWTLPSNLALAVHPNLIYAKIKDLNKQLVIYVAECRLKQLYKDPKTYKLLDKIEGKDMEGWEYQPMFDYFLDRKKDGCFVVICANYVTMDTGTGIVHTAPGFGADDYKICVKKGIIKPDNPIVPIDQNGNFIEEVKDFAGMYVKQADKLIKKWIKEKGRMMQQSTINHNYPFCWRSDTPLIYKAVDCWFIKVTDLKDKIIANNLKSYWVPKSIQQGRFNNWLNNVEDWCFSRNRFWGNPIPIWISSDGQQIICVGSIKQLQELSGEKNIKDLHRENIDHITIPSKQGKGNLKRIEEVFDCWFESGAMPYAQVHYPFTISPQKFKSIFPADFIGQGIDQTRGWFYTLLVISTALFDNTPYKNLIVNGLVLTEQGKKMSKRKKNYPDPIQVANQFGVDAIRLYMINSPIVKGQNLLFSKEGIKGVVKDIILPWINAYRFLVQNSIKWQKLNNKEFVFDQKIVEDSISKNILDRWICAALQDLIYFVRNEMNYYRLYTVVPKLVKFLGQLTNWYVRMNRNRIKNQKGQEEMWKSLNVLYYTLLSINILMSPYVPFLTEWMYQNLKGSIPENSKFANQSIHFLIIPEGNQNLMNSEIVESFKLFEDVVECARNLKQNKKISLKKPVQSLKIVTKNKEVVKKLQFYQEYIIEQVNVDKIQFSQDIDQYIILTCIPNHNELGKKLKKNYNKDFIKKVNSLTPQQLKDYLNKGFIEVMGHKLEGDNIFIKQSLNKQNLLEHQLIAKFQQGILILDTRQNQKLILKGLARQITNRIQKLKKKTGIQIDDQILIFYDLGPRLLQAYTAQIKSIKNSVKKPIYHYSENQNFILIGHCKQKFEQQNLEIWITRRHIFINQKKMKQLVGEKYQNVFLAIRSQKFINIKQKYQSNQKLRMNVEGKELIFEQGLHWFMNYQPKI